MPYYKRYYRKRPSYGRYKKRTFTRFNTYKNRSSKAQAYQIYKLNKKVNHVYKMAKPEIQIYTDDKYHNNGQAHIEANLDTTHTNGMNSGIVQLIGKQNEVFNGHYARIKDVSLSGGLTFMGNPANIDQHLTCGLRLIFFRLKNDQYANPARTDVLRIINDKNQEYYMTSPLEEGFSTRYKLVADRKFYLKPVDSPSKCFRIRFKYPYSLRSAFGLDYDSSGTYNNPANTLYCVWYIARLGTITANDSVDTFSSEVYLKFAYTDDNYTTPGTTAKNIDEKNEDNDEDNDTKNN